MKTIQKSYSINASLRNVWQCLIDESLIKQWTESETDMNDKVGHVFSLWNGDIYGKNTQVVKNKKLVQEWYLKDWKEASRVEFELAEKDGKTHLKLVHTLVPDEEAESIDCGWDDFFLMPMKNFAENI